MRSGIHTVDDGTDWNFYAQDGLGSVRAVVDDAAVVQSSMSYDPYGNPMASYGAGFGFTGEQTDTNGSVFLRARYYEPGLGVFSALDPFEGKSCTPMSLNGYSWVEGNVPNAIDPSGNCPDNPWYIDVFGRHCRTLARNLADQYGISFEELVQLPYDDLLLYSQIGIISPIANNLENNAPIIPTLAQQDLRVTLEALSTFICDSDTHWSGKVLGVIATGITLWGEATRRLGEFITAGKSYNREIGYTGLGSVGILPQSNLNAFVQQSNTTTVVTSQTTSSTLGNTASGLAGVSIGYNIAGSFGDFFEWTDSFLYSTSQSQTNSNSNSSQQRWGTCNENQYNPLLNAMEAACKQRKITGCSENSLKKLRERLRQPGQRVPDVVITREHVQEIINNNLSCDAARQAIQDTCYANSPHTAHNNEIQRLQSTRQDCYTLLNSLP